MARLKIGELLTEAKILSREQLDQALELQRTEGKKLGVILTQLGLVTETQLTQTLGRQLSIPWVSLYHIDFSRQLLNLVPREAAERYCLVPIYVRKVRHQGETLYVAMDDPTNESALADLAKAAGIPVRPMIACPSDIRSAIRVYYGGSKEMPAVQPVKAPPAAASPAPAIAPPTSTSTPTSTPMSSPTPSSAAARTTRSQPPPGSTLESRIAASEVDSPDAWPEVEASTLDIPKRKGGPRMVALTMLDGTTIRLPARPRAGGAMQQAHAAAPGQLTARDFIAALRAVAHGQDASEVLGEKVPLEAMCAAILSVLLRKGLIADWEFVEELQKM